MRLTVRDLVATLLVVAIAVPYIGLLIDGEMPFVQDARGMAGVGLLLGGANTFLFARDGYRCQYCGRHRSQLRGREFLTRDHIIPMSRGGYNAWHNVVTACSPCNNRKGSHLAEEVHMHPLHSPHEPNYVELVWAVRRITTVQAKYIKMFYGADVLRALQSKHDVGLPLTTA